MNPLKNVKQDDLIVVTGVLMGLASTGWSNEETAAALGRVAKELDKEISHRIFERSVLNLSKELKCTRKEARAHLRRVMKEEGITL